MTWTHKFKKGDRVRVTETYSDVFDGQTGVIKRVASGYPVNGRCNYVVCFDDGTGWTDHQEGGLGWNVEDIVLELDNEFVDFEMDA